MTWKRLEGNWVFDELVRRLCEADEPKTWPQITRMFPGEDTKTRDNNLSMAMQHLIQRNMLVMTKVKRKNQAGYEWEENYYSMNALQKLAAIE